MWAHGTQNLSREASSKVQFQDPLHPPEVHLRRRPFMFPPLSSSLYNPDSYPFGNSKVGKLFVVLLGEIVTKGSPVGLIDLGTNLFKLATTPVQGGKTAFDSTSPFSPSTETSSFLPSSFGAFFLKNSHFPF